MAMIKEKDADKYVVIDRRNGFKRRVSNDTFSDQDKRQGGEDRRVGDSDVPVISKESLTNLIETVRLEIQLLVEFFKDQERKKLNVVNSSIGTFTIFITGLVTIIFLANKFDAISSSQQQAGTSGISSEFITIMFFVVLGGLGLINLVLIKYMASLRAGTVLAMRQLNCLRQALDSATYAQIEGYFPKKIESLYSKDTIYHAAFGKHRKLPLHNEYLKKDCAKIIKPADHFAIFMISLFTCGLLGAPVYYFYRVAEDSKLNGVISAVMLVIFISFVAKIAWSSRKDILSQVGAK